MTTMEGHMRALDADAMVETAVEEKLHPCPPHHAQCDETFVDIETYVSVLSTWHDEFSSPLTDVCSHSQQLKIVSARCDFPYGNAPLVCN